MAKTGTGVYGGMYGLVGGDIGKGPGDDTGTPRWGAIAAYVPTASTIVSVLADAETNDVLMILNLAGGRNQWTDPGPVVNGTTTRIFNRDKYDTQLTRWTVAGGASSAVATAISDALTSRRAVVYTVDEPHHSVFNDSITKESQNWMGLRSKELWPGCITVQRSASTNLSPAPTGGWTGLDYGWAAYSGPQNRGGRTAAEFWADEMTALDALDLGMFVSNNWLDGGDGRLWDYLNTGSSSGRIAGQSGVTSQWMCSPAELEERADALVALTGVADIPAYVDWSYIYSAWTPTAERDALLVYQNRSDYRVANDYVLTKLSQRTTWSGWRTAKGSTAPPASLGVQWINSQYAAATTVTVPTHLAGDLLIMEAWRIGDATLPSLPAGWTSITTGTSNNVPLRMAYRIATAPGTTSGTWTNAQGLIVSVYRGAHPTTPIGDNSVMAASGTSTIIYQDITFTQSNGTSWVHAAGIHATATNVNSPPSGMLLRASGGQGAVFDSNNGLSTWIDTNVVVSASGAWRAFTVEIIADPAGAAPPVNQPPVLSTIADQSVVADSLLTFTASATDPEGHTVQYALLAGATAVPTGAVINATTGVFTWTPTRDQVGTHNVIVRATDITGTNPVNPTDEQALAITVTPVPDDPGLELPPESTAATALEVAQRATVDFEAALDLVQLVIQAEQLNAAVITKAQLLLADLQTSREYMDDVVADLTP